MKIWVMIFINWFALYDTFTRLYSIKIICAGQWLIAINRIQNKRFCLYMCTVHIYDVRHTHTCMCVYLYIYNNYTQYTHIGYYVKKNILDAINLINKSISH